MAHRSVWWLGVATLVAAVVLPVTPPTGSVTAEEQTQCDQPGYPQLERCYAILTSAADSRGSGFWIKIRDGLTYDPDSMFVQSVQWITMPGGWWIEAGYRYGTTVRCGSRTTPTWYTARWNAVGYDDWCPAGTPSFGSDHFVRVSNLDCCRTRRVFIDGNLRYTLNLMKEYGTALQLGVEANHWATQLNNVWSWNYKRRTLNGQWETDLWPNVEPLRRGTPSAYGSRDGFGVWKHGFWGI